MPFQDCEFRTRFEQFGRFKQEARTLLDLVEHKGEQHQVAAGGRHRDFGVAGLEDTYIAKPMLCHAAAHSGEHFTLYICSIDMACIAYDACGWNGEETGAAANVGDGLPCAQADAAQQLIGLERLMPLVSEQEILVSCIKFAGHKKLPMWADKGPLSMVAQR